MLRSHVMKTETFLPQVTYFATYYGLIGIKTECIVYLKLRDCHCVRIETWSVIPFVKTTNSNSKTVNRVDITASSTSRSLNPRVIYSTNY